MKHADNQIGREGAIARRKTRIYKFKISSFASSFALSRLRGSVLHCVILLTILTIAAVPIPVANRIPATVTRTISSPPSDPLVMPTDAAVDATGNVYVADGVNDRIVRFSSKGTVDSIFRGPAESPLSRPVGVAIDSAGALWISDTGNHRLVVRSADGTSSKLIEVPPMTAEKLADPTGIVVREDGSRTYVADCGNHRILVRDNKTGKWTPLGEWGVSLGQFRWPFMLCIGEDNHVLITETLGARVQQISSTNRWGGQIGQFGVAMGNLYRPKGVASDKTGRIFVGDSTLGVIQAFDSGGNVLGVLTDNTGQPLRFDHPMGMRFDSAGSLYVVELSSNRVAVVSLKQPATKP